MEDLTLAMTFSWGTALLAGLVGTLAMTVFWYAARAAGWMKLDWGQLLGTYFMPPGKRALALGLVWHFLTGLLFGVVYTYLFTQARITPGVWSGLALGAIHGLVALAMLYYMPRTHPILPDRPATSVWSARDLALYGLGFPVFGAVFGGTYRFYDTWVSAYGMEPSRFWLTAFGTVAVMLVVGLSAYVLISREREEESPIFAMATLSPEEQRQALTRLYERGHLTEDEYMSELEDLEGPRGGV